MQGFVKDQLVAGFQLKFADGTIRACGDIYFCQETGWKAIQGPIAGIRWTLQTKGEYYHPSEFGFVLGD